MVWTQPSGNSASKVPVLGVVLKPIQPEGGSTMKKITVVGIDLAKAHFQLHGVDEAGNVLFRKTLTPEKTAVFMANLQQCLVGMEACGGGHFWARKLIAMGHEVRLIPPQHVRALVAGNHNDAGDAEAIAELATSKRLRFVPVKTSEHQDLQNFHRIRQGIISRKVALTNQIRGILYEYGHRIPKGDKSLRVFLADQLGGGTFSAHLQAAMQDLYDELLVICKRVNEQEKILANIARQDERCRRLMTIPGVGPLISTAIIAAVPDVSAFRNGRHFAAWLGLVPGHRHTGGPTRKVIMLGITKRGDRYLRKLVIQGARAWLVMVERYDTKRAKWARKLRDQKGFNKAAVAIANKNARTMWALLATNETYQAAKAA
jgi:transposase